MIGQQSQRGTPHGKQAIAPRCDAERRWVSAREFPQRAAAVYDPARQGSVWPPRARLSALGRSAALPRGVRCGGAMEPDHPTPRTPAEIGHRLASAAERFKAGQGDADQQRAAAHAALTAAIDAVRDAVPHDHLLPLLELHRALLDLDSGQKPYLLQKARRRGNHSPPHGILQQRGIVGAALELRLRENGGALDEAARWVARRIRRWPCAKNQFESRAGRGAELHDAVQRWRTEASKGGDRVDAKLYRLLTKGPDQAPSAEAALSNGAGFFSLNL